MKRSEIQAVFSSLHYALRVFIQGRITDINIQIMTVNFQRYLFYVNDGSAFCFRFFVGYINELPAEAKNEIVCIAGTEPLLLCMRITPVFFALFPIGILQRDHCLPDQLYRQKGQGFFVEDIRQGLSGYGDPDQSVSIILLQVL